MENKPLDPIDRISEKFSRSNLDNSIELFKASEKDVDIKTDLTHEEQVLMACILTENDLISNKLKGFSLYGSFSQHFMRTKISLDRKSRAEFTRVNDKGSMDRDAERMSALKNLSEVRN